MMISACATAIGFSPNLEILRLSESQPSTSFGYADYCLIPQQPKLDITTIKITQNDVIRHLTMGEQRVMSRALLRSVHIIDGDEVNQDWAVGMLDVDDAHGILAEKLAYDAGKFCAPAKDLSIGVGQIYSGIRFPLYSADSGRFQTASGIVYVLTHECDVDQNNQRTFNSELLICPVIDFRIFVEEYQGEYTEEVFISFISSLAHREVSRVIYIPCYGEELPYGGLLYLNQITNTHVSAFLREGSHRLWTVTNYGLRVIDQSLTQHLLRPKAEALPL